MALSRRKLVASAAAVGALSVSPACFAPAIAQNKPLRDRHSRAALRHRRGARHQRHPRHAMGGRALQRAGRHRRPQGRAGGRGGDPRPRTPSSASASSCSRTRSTACRASSRPASASRSARWSRRRARSRSTGTAPRRTASKEKIAEPALPLPQHRQRVRGGDGLAARDQALEGQVQARSPASTPTIPTAATTWRPSSPLLKRFNIEHEVVTEQWPKVGTMDLTSHVAALKAAKPDLIFSSLLFADLPVFMKQAHAAGLTEGTKLVFPAAGWQHTLMKKEFTPEGMMFGHNTLYFANPNGSPLAKEFVAWYDDKHKDYPELGSRPRLFRHRVLQGGGGEGRRRPRAAWPVAGRRHRRHGSASRSRASAARAPGARTTSPTRPSCRASPPTRTNTTSSRSATFETMYSADLQKPAGAELLGVDQDRAVQGLIRATNIECPAFANILARRRFSRRRAVSGRRRAAARVRRAEDRQSGLRLVLRARRLFRHHASSTWRMNVGVCRLAAAARC